MQRRLTRAGVPRQSDTICPLGTKRSPARNPFRRNQSSAIWESIVSQPPRGRRRSRRPRVSIIRAALDRHTVLYYQL